MEALKEYMAKLDWNRVYKFVLSDNKNKEGQYRKVSAELKKRWIFYRKIYTEAGVP